MTSHQYPIFFFLWRYWITDYCCWRVSLLPVQNLTVMSLYEPEIWRWLCAPNPACLILVFWIVTVACVPPPGGVFVRVLPHCTFSKKNPILQRKGNQATLELNGNLDMFDCTYMQLHSYSWLFLWVRAAPVFLQTEPWFLLDVRSINQEHCRSKRGRWEKNRILFQVWTVAVGNKAWNTARGLPAQANVQFLIVSWIH